MSQDYVAGAKHPFHLVDPSPWPLLGSLGAFLAALGTILMMHDYTPYVLYFGLFLVLFVMAGWFRDIIKESKNEHTPRVRMGFRYGMVMFIASEVMFFVAFFWAFVNSALDPNDVKDFAWPPANIQTLNPFDLPWFNTLLLLLSGTTITWAHHSLLEGDIKDMIQKTMMTIGLGVVFLVVQAFEYMHAPFLFKDGIYPSTFYMATGFHGFHVFVGACFLTVTWYRAKQGQFTKDDHFGFEAAAWYWHFVDVVWLFLFVLVYIWGSGN